MPNYTEYMFTITVYNMSKMYDSRVIYWRVIEIICTSNSEEYPLPISTVLLYSCITESPVIS